MIESEDGTVTGSIDVNRLDQIDAKTDEAKAQLDALKREAQAGQEQAAKDAEAKAESERATSVEGQRESQKESTVDSVPAGDQKSSDQGGDKAPAKKAASSGKDS
jgi:sRNA-binding protein